MFITRLDTRDVYLLPIDWNIICLEDCFDRLRDFGTNAIAWWSVSCAARRSMGFVLDLPGIKVTVYLPPNLVGLKMSDDSVAIARRNLKLSYFAQWHR